MLKRLFRFFFILAFLTPVLLHSQDYLGIANSAFAGVNGIDVNPASIVNNPRKWDVTLIGINFMFGNNYMGLSKSAFDHSGSLLTGNYPAFNDGDHFIENYMSKRSPKAVSVFTGLNLMLPSFMFTRPKHKDAFAFTCRSRIYANVDGVDPTLAGIIINGENDSVLFHQDFSALRVSVQTMAWNEYGLSYGRTIAETNNERLNVAGRLKYLQGLYSIYLFTDHVDYNFYASDSVLIESSLIHYGHSTNMEFTPDAAKDALKLKAGGKPMFGLDLGATYEFHPLTDVRSRMRSESNTTPMMHEYKYKIGLSVQDLGWIKYLKPENARDFKAELSVPFDFNTLSTSGTTPLNGADDSLELYFKMDPNDTKYRMNLPTLISAQGDYYAGHNVYVNSTLNYAFQFRKNEDKIHEVTTMSITPRWDWKWLGLYLPISFNKYSHFRLGLTTRIGPLIIGTADLLPLISKRNIYGADFHFMIKVPHIQFKKKNKEPRTKSKFNVNRKPDKKRNDRTNMPKRDHLQADDKKTKDRPFKKENREPKSKKHIFPKVKLFKNKKKHNMNPDQEEKTIYFKL